MSQFPSTSDNPFAATPAPVEDVPFTVGLRRILIQWELLRVGYNLVLVTEVLAIAGSLLLAKPYFLAECIAAGVAANLCFCLGPALDVYLMYLTGRRWPIIWILFPLGLLFSMFAAFVGIIGEVFPAPN